MAVREITLKPAQLEDLRDCIELQFIEGGERTGSFGFKYSLDEDKVVDPLGQNGSTVTIIAHEAPLVSSNVQRCVVSRFATKAPIAIGSSEFSTEDTFESSLRVDNPYNPEAWGLYQEAKRLLESGDFDAADRKFQEATDKDGSMAPAWMARGRAQLQYSRFGNKWSIARYYFDSAIEENPEYADAYYYAALCSVREASDVPEESRRKYEIKHFKKYLQLAPDGLYARDAKRRLAVLVREHVAWCFQEAAKTDDDSAKIRLMSDLLEIDRFNPRAMLSLARLYKGANPEKAIKLFMLAAEFDPDNKTKRKSVSTELVTLANELKRDKKYELVLKALEAAYELDPDNHYLLPLVISGYERLEGKARFDNYEKEIGVLYRLAMLSEEHRDDAISKLEAIGKECVEKKKYGLARLTYEALLKLKPDEAIYHFKLARVMTLKLGISRRDKKTFEKAIPYELGRISEEFHKCETLASTSLIDKKDLKEAGKWINEIEGYSMDLYRKGLDLIESEPEKARDIFNNAIIIDEDNPLFYAAVVRSYVAEAGESEIGSDNLSSCLSAARYYLKYAPDSEYAEFMTEVLERYEGKYEEMRAEDEHRARIGMRAVVSQRKRDRIILCSDIDCGEEWLPGTAFLSTDPEVVAYREAHIKKVDELVKGADILFSQRRFDEAEQLYLRLAQMSMHLEINAYVYLRLAQIEWMKGLDYSLGSGLERRSLAKTRYYLSSAEPISESVKHEYAHYAPLYDMLTEIAGSRS